MSGNDRRWLWLVHGSLRVPYVGPAILVVVSSVLHYRWRRTVPGRARWLNRHAWIAIGLNVCANRAIFALARR